MKITNENTHTLFRKPHSIAIKPCPSAIKRTVNPLHHGVAFSSAPPVRLRGSYKTCEQRYNNDGVRLPTAPPHR